MNIPELHVGRPMHAGPVTVFPVWADAKQTRGLSTGTQAQVEVGELPDGAQVPLLTVTNLGTTPVLLLEGELLEGGMQTRALAYDLLLAPSASAVVEVACVEQGRWHGANRHARRARNVSASVKHGLRREDGSRQSAVWGGVERYEATLGATASQSFADHLDRVDASLVEAGTVSVLPGQTGVIVGVAGWPVTLELFGSRAALIAHLPAILDAARLDAALSATTEPAPGRRARRFADLLSGLPFQPRRAVR